MKTVTLASYCCKGCSLEHGGRKTSLSTTRKNWLHVRTKCNRCNVSNLVVILG